MSSDYLKYKLFVPFSQENTLSPGMGLGLSIVQQLARGVGGSVDVRSSVGVGTLVEVLIPLEQDLEDTASMLTAVEHDRPSYDVQRRLLSGRTVCLITPESYVAMVSPGLQVTNRMHKRSRAVEQALKTNAGAALEMNIVLGTAECPNPPADVYVLDGDVLNEVAMDTATIIPAKYSAVAPLVLLCAAAGPPSCSKQEALKRHLFHLHNPLGPRKLASVLSTAIEAGSQPVTKALLAETHVAPPAEQTSSTASCYPTSLPARLKEDVIPRPAEEQPPAAQPTSSISHDATATTSELQSKSYHLLVDDNPINVKLLATVMGRLNHTFSTACDGLEAVQLYKESLQGQQRPFDMIFMDISMPVMDGFEATREIRQLESQAKVPRCKIVALTGLSSEESRDEALASGSDVFLTKPAKLDKVRRLINEQLGGSRSSAAPLLTT